MLSKDAFCGQFVDNTGDNSAHVIPVPQVAAIIGDFSKEMNDYDHAESNVTQATRIYQQAGVTLDIFFTILYTARTKTRKATGVSNRMAYFFEVLRGLTCTPTSFPHRDQRDGRDDIHAQGHLDGT